MVEYKVAAVILNYNSSSECEKCVRFLQRQDYEALSVIVVDNASSIPGEQKKLEEMCKRENIEFIRSSRNKGFSAGNNVGLRAAAELGIDWMLVLNPDVELRDPHYIRFVMEQIPNWPNTAVIGTNVLLPDGRRQNPMRELTILEEILWPFETVKQKFGLWDGYQGRDQTGYCKKLSGCCFFIARDFLERNNYLDERVFLYCEEPILAKAVSKKGFQELYIRETTANHEHYSGTKSGNSKSRMIQFLKSRCYYIDQYSEYGRVGRYLALQSRKLQMAVWKCRK